MPILCIDIGNTNAHVGVVDNCIVLDRCDIDTRLVAVASDQARGIVEHYASRVDGVAYASVVPVANSGLVSILEKTGHAKDAFNLRHDTLRGLKISYPRPTEIGQDRLANSVAAQELCGLPVIAVSMGTATVFDVLTSDGYAGGMIAPGLASFTDYLHEKTAQLPLIDPNDLDTPGAIGRSTLEAMQNGVRWGYIGMVKEMLAVTLRELERTEKTAPAILTTGGGSNILPKDCLPGARHIADLGLIGLEVAFRRAH